MGSKPVKLVKTWIEGFDEMLGGGLPDKSVILMLGEPGSEYDTFAQQLLYQHALKGGKVAYFTSFRSPEIIREDFETFGWNISSLEEANQWIFVDVRSPEASRTLEKEIPLRIREGRWILIGSLSSLLLVQEYQSILKLIELLLDSTRKHGGIHFLLLTQGMHGPQTEMTLQYLADGVIEFIAQEVGGGIDRRMRIKKMRKAVYVPRLIPFSLTEHGVTIETAVRIA